MATRGRLALLLALASFAVAGCGGEEIAAEEVPGGPAALTLPPDEALPTPDATAEADADADATPTPTAEADATTGGTTGAAPAAPATGGTTGGGTTAPPAQEEPAAPENETGGADFEDFCQQNPGAC